MVVAYLQGLLKPHHQFGLRSQISETVILEGIASGMICRNMENAIDFDLATLPILNQKGVQKASERLDARMKRAAELRAFDFFRVADQLSGKLKLQNSKNEFSLYQLYQIAEKEGIFEQLDLRASKKTFKNVL